MANMSYCRFHNTRLDMEDCLEVFCGGEEISKEEARAGRRMFERILDFCEGEGIIDGYDPEELRKLFDNITEED